jgi:hypothetical protein
VHPPLHVDLQLVVGQHADPDLALAALVVTQRRDRLTRHQHATAVLGDAVRLDLVTEVPHDRTHGECEQKPQQVHATSLARVAGVCWPSTCENGQVIAGDFSDPTNERIIYLSALGLAIVGLVLLVGTIIWWRRGRQEHPVLAPLEVMGGRAWVKAPEGDRRRRLDQVRAGGVGEGGDEPVHSDPVDLQALVRSVPQAFDDLREPGAVVAESVAVEEPVAEGEPVAEEDPVAEEEPVAEEQAAEGEPDEVVALADEDDEQSPDPDATSMSAERPPEAAEVLVASPNEPSA